MVEPIRQSCFSSKYSLLYYNTLPAKATALAIKELKASNGELEPKALQDYLK